MRSIHLIAAGGFFLAFIVLPYHLPLPGLVLFSALLISAAMWRKKSDTSEGERYLVATFFLLSWFFLQVIPGKVFSVAGKMFGGQENGWFSSHIFAIPFLFIAVMPSVVLLRNRHNGISFFSFLFKRNVKKEQKQKSGKIEYIDFVLGVDAEFPEPKVVKK